MGPNQIVQRQHSERIFPGHLASADGSEELPEFNGKITQRKICGQLLSVHGDVELPVEGACIEIHSVMSLKRVVNELSAPVLAHCRILLMNAVKPVDLYQPSKHIADAPLLSFADVLKVCDIPGYELLAAAAWSHEDASFRRLLGSNLAIARLLLCYYHPASFPNIHATSAVTNEVGCFQSTVLESGSADDRPGYLFIARHKISSCLYITLYDPSPAAWYTHWDLPLCATVTLRTRHPMALRGYYP